VLSVEAALRAAVRQYEREKSKLDQRSARNTAKRDAAIRNAHTAGLTMREIAKIAGVSHQRVAQVVGLLDDYLKAQRERADEAARAGAHGRPFCRSPATV
jgi:hypothetical protein